MSKKKGIILAGGTGSRLFPITKAISKQLLPVYDKPMIYYPLSTLMSSGIRDILIITNPKDREIFEILLGDGSQFGINLEFANQNSPNGIAEAFIIGEKFIKDSKVTLILGDNIFHGSNINNLLIKSINMKNGAFIFAYPVKDPERYGVIEFDLSQKVISLEEKPKNPKSNFAVTGLYFYDETVFDKAKKVTPSDRGELEISSLNQIYLDEGNLKVEILNRGSAWLDTGTFDALQEANQYIRILEERQGLKIGCPEEISWRQKWINDKDLEDLARQFPKSGYGHYLLKLIK